MIQTSESLNVREIYLDMTYMFPKRVSKRICRLSTFTAVSNKSTWNKLPTVTGIFQFESSVQAKNIAR